MSITCTALLRECKNFRFLLQVHGSFIVSGLKPHNQLVNAYSLFQRPDLSRIIFKSVRDPGVVLWNSMIRGYTRAGFHREALEFFNYMSEKGKEPDKYTFTFALKACTGSMDFEEGNSLVERYAKCGMIEYSNRCFTKIRNKNMVSWNTMPSAYAVTGLASCAVSLILYMQENKLKPDFVSFLSALSACRHAGLVEEGKRIFEDMEERSKIGAKAENYACMVDLLGKAGLFGEAVEMMRRMKVKLSIGLWGSFIEYFKNAL